MAAFTTMAAAEIRAYAQVASHVWINAFAERKPDGTIACRVQQPMSATNPAYGGWTDITDDATN